MCANVFAATLVGGGYVLGSAEVVYNPKKGLVWAIGPISLATNLIIGKKKKKKMNTTA